MPIAIIMQSANVFAPISEQRHARLDRLVQPCDPEDASDSDENALLIQSERHFEGKNEQTTHNDRTQSRSLERIQKLVSIPTDLPRTAAQS